MLAQDDGSSRLGQILIGLERTELDADTAGSGGSRSVRATGGNGTVPSGDFRPYHNAHAAHVRFGARIAAEGGGDVSASWAAPPQ